MHKGGHGRPLNSVVSHPKMGVIVKRIVIPLAAIVVLWLVVILGSSLSIEALFGIGVAERLTPFSNAHLLEEAAEGTYNPLADWLFVTFRALVALVAFGLGTVIAAFGARRKELALAIVPSLAGIALMAVSLSYVWSESYPSTMRNAFLIEVLMCIGASIIGLAVGSSLKSRGVATDG
jgi:hypothetical protein